MIYLICRQHHGEEWKRSRSASREAEVKEAKVLSHRLHAKAVHPIQSGDRVIEVGPLVGSDSPDLLAIRNAIVAYGFPRESIEWEPTIPVSGAVDDSLSTEVNFNFDPDGRMVIARGETPAEIAARAMTMMGEAAARVGKTIEGTLKVLAVNSDFEKLMNQLLKTEESEVKKAIEESIRDSVKGAMKQGNDVTDIEAKVGGVDLFRARYVAAKPKSFRVIEDI